MNTMTLLTVLLYTHIAVVCFVVCVLLMRKESAEKKIRRIRYECTTAWKNLPISKRERMCSYLMQGLTTHKEYCIKPADIFEAAATRFHIPKTLAMAVFMAGADNTIPGYEHIIENLPASDWYILSCIPVGVRETILSVY